MKYILITLPMSIEVSHLLVLCEEKPLYINYVDPYCMIQIKSRAIGYPVGLVCSLYIVFLLCMYRRNAS